MDGTWSTKSKKERFETRARRKRERMKKKREHAHTDVPPATPPAGMDEALFRQAVVEHAKFLGMDPAVDECYFWIAEEALTAPLPPNWEQGVSEDGTPYHYNTVTEESIWEHPKDQEYREMYARVKREDNEREATKPSTSDDDYLASLARRGGQQQEGDAAAESGTPSDQHGNSMTVEDFDGLDMPSEKRSEVHPLFQRGGAPTDAVGSGVPAEESSSADQWMADIAAEMVDDSDEDRSLTDSFGRSPSSVKRGPESWKRPFDDNNTSQQRLELNVDTAEGRSVTTVVGRSSSPAATFVEDPRDSRQADSDSAALRDQIRELKRELERERVKALDAEDEASRFKAEVEAMRSRLASTQAEAQREVERNTVERDSGHTATIKKLEDRLAESEQKSADAVASARSEAEKLRSELRGAQVELAAAQSKISSLEEEIDRSVKRRIEAEDKASESIVATSATTLTQTKLELEDTKATLDSERARWRGLSDEVVDSRERAAKAERERATAEREVEAREAKLRSSELRNVSLSTEVSSLKSRLGTAESVCEELRRSVERLEHEQRLERESMAAAKERQLQTMASAKAELLEARNASAEAKEEASRLGAELRSLKQRNDLDAMDAASKANKVVAERERQIEARSQALKRAYDDRMKELLTSRKQAQRDAEKQHRALQCRITELESANRSMKSELALSAKEEIERVRTAEDARMTTATALREEQTRSSRLKSAASRNEDRAKRAETAVQEAEATIAELRAALESGGSEYPTTTPATGTGGRGHISHDEHLKVVESAREEAARKVREAEGAAAAALRSKADAEKEAREMQGEKAALEKRYAATLREAMCETAQRTADEWRVRFNDHAARMKRDVDVAADALQREKSAREHDKIEADKSLRTARAASHAAEEAAANDKRRFLEEIRALNIAIQELRHANAELSKQKMREANVLVENTNKTARQIEDRITLLRTQCKELNASMQQQDTASDMGGLAPRSSRRSSHLSGGENLTGNSGSMILGSNSTFSSSVNAVATAPSLSLETVQIGTSTDRLSITDYSARTAELIAQLDGGSGRSPTSRDKESASRASSTVSSEYLHDGGRDHGASVVDNAGTKGRKMLPGAESDLNSSAWYQSGFWRTRYLGHDNYEMR